MNRQVEKTEITPVPSFCIHPSPSPAPPSTALALSFGRAVQHSKRKLKMEPEIEPELSAPTTKKAARIGQQVFSTIEILENELRSKTQLATHHTQYLKTELDSSSSVAAEVTCRYSDIPCPRQTAVMVHEGKFLHANFVSDTECTRVFVASQYPTDLLLFWNFIVQNPHDIFDLSSESCSYAPSNIGDEKKFGTIHVQLVDKEEKLSNLCMYYYEISDTSTGTAHLIRRLCYTGWTKHGVLSAADLSSLVSYLETALSEKTLIHCSGGIGRTGTLIAGFFLKDRILQGKTDSSNLESSLIELIVYLRRQRGPRFVQNQQQLSLLHQFAQDLLSHSSQSDDEESSTQPLAEADHQQATDRTEPSQSHSLTELSQIPLSLVPQTPSFQSILSIELSQRTPPHLLEQVFDELPRIKIWFDRSTRKLHFGYGTSVVRALAEISPSLEEIVGYSYCTIFDRSLHLYANTWKFESPHLSVQSLLETAHEYFTKLHLPKRPSLSLSQKPTERELLLQCLKTQPGLCIGENHSDSSSKDFLCTHLPFLVAHGVTTLFFEQLPQESLQDEIDQFFTSPKEAPMPSALSAYLDYLSAGHGIPRYRHGFKNVIVAAKAAGLQRIVCIDTETTYSAGTNKKFGVTDVPKRLLAMNYHAAQAIASNKNPGKYIVFAGGAHIPTIAGIPGLADITGCSSILVYQASSTEEVGIRCNVQVADYNTTALFDIAVKRLSS